MNKITKNIIKYIITFIIMIGVFIFLLTLTSLIPSKKLKDNMNESSEILWEETNKKSVNVFYKSRYIEFDNYSDALMLNTAYSIDSNKPLYSAFVARKNYIPGVTKVIIEDSVGELQSDSIFEYHDEVGELYSFVNEALDESFEYGRYWHGYLVFLRPLLTIFNISQIRMLLNIIFFALAIVLMYLIHKKINSFIALLFLVALIGVEFFYMGISIQGSSIFLITMVFSIIILLRGNKIKDISYCFFIVGMLTSFFDFLTVPILTLGMPLIILFLTKQVEKKLTLKEEIIILLKTGILWFIGYSFNWISKWILIDLIYNKNLIEVAIGQIMFRTVGTEKFYLIDTIEKLYKYVERPARVSIVLVIIYDIIKYKFKVESNTTIKEKFTLLFPYIVVFLLPIIWCTVLRDHSYKHDFFTYRNMLLILTTLPIIMSLYLNEKSILSKKHSVKSLIPKCIIKMINTKKQKI